MEQEAKQSPLTGRRVAAIIAIVVALVSLSLLLGYFFLWGRGAAQYLWAIAEQSPWVIGLLVTFLIAVSTLMVIGYSEIREWLGFGTDGDKTGLDLLQFLVTASIPIIVALGGIWFTADQNKNREVVEERRSQDEVLQAYIEEMGRLLVNGQLLETESTAVVRTVAQARTQNTLMRLDGTGDKRVMQFLHDSELLSRPYPPTLSLKNVDLSQIDLSRADLSLVALEGLELNYANLRGTDLSGADLRYADLDYADLSGANLTSADLRDAHLNYAAKLFHTNLHGTDLGYADLSGADMSEAWMEGAQLTNADLSGAHLADAHLSQANLSGARGVTNEELEEQAESLKGATMPDGSKHD